MDNGNIFKYGELEAELCLSDYTHAERWEAAAAGMAAAYSGSGGADALTGSAQLKASLLAVRAFFDAVFGDGAAERAFGDTTDLSAALAAAAALHDFAEAQNERTRALYEKYAPRSGR